MATLIFDRRWSRKDNTTSQGAYQFGYFDELLRRSPSFGPALSLSGMLSNRAALEVATGYLQDRLNSFKELDGSKLPPISMRELFDTPGEIRSATNWLFSAKADFIRLGNFYLDDSQGMQLVDHTYEGDSFNLGSGSDYFQLSVSFYGDPLGLAYADAEDEALDGGYWLAVDGGPGADRLFVSYNYDALESRSDYSCDKLIDGQWMQATVIPVARISGGIDNDRISVLGIAGLINGDDGADVLSGSIFSDWITGGRGSDVISGSPDVDAFSNPEMYALAVLQKDLLSGGVGKDSFIIGGVDSYGLNGDADFFVINDFEKTDRIASMFKRGDLLIEGTDGSLLLEATSAYGAQSFKYTARLYLDSDDSGKVSAGDELLGYVCGFQPTSANLVYGI